MVKKEQNMRFRIKNGHIVVPDVNIRKKLESQGYYIYGKIGIIDPIEALFLVQEKGASIYDGDKELTFSDVLNKFSIDEKKFYAYKDLRIRGYNISIKDSTVTLKDGRKYPFYVFSPYDVAEFSGNNGFLAIVDDDMDTTYFIYDIQDPRGNTKNDVNITFKNEDKRRLFLDLVERNFKIHSGLKFGTEFIVYEKDTDKHSKYMVKILRKGMEWIEIAGLARVANGVKKILLMAIMVEEIKYYSLVWVRA